MFLPNLKFHRSYASVEECPVHEENRIVAFAGRSNSGKSSLISALANEKNLARVSQTPGKTRLINYFRLRGGAFRYWRHYLADLPGYGYAQVSKKERAELQHIVNSYLALCRGLVLVVLVLDARRSLEQEEKTILYFGQSVGLPVILARSKWDKLNQKERTKAFRDWEKEGLYEISYPVSSTKLSGIEEITERITEAMMETPPF